MNGAAADPQSNPAFVPGGRRLGVDAAWQWIVDGYKLFAKAPGIWIAISLILWVWAVIPVLGFLLLMVSTLIAAGIMQGCRDLEEGRPLSIGHIAAALQSPRLGSLVLLALLDILLWGVYSAGGFVAGLLFGLFGLLGPLGIAICAIIFGPFILLGAMVVLATTWFSVPLVLFHNISPLQSIKHSLLACWRNFWPILIYSILIVGLFGAGALALFLGLLVVLPLYMTSAYVSYQAIFLAPNPPLPQ